MGGRDLAMGVSVCVGDHILPTLFPSGPFERPGGRQSPIQKATLTLSGLSAALKRARTAGGRYTSVPASREIKE